MKKIILFSCLLTFVTAFAACNQSFMTPKQTPSNDKIPSIGEIHNEFLGMLFERIDARIGKDGSSAVSPANREDIALRVANKLAAKYGAEPLSREDVRSAIEQGRQMAMEDPVELVKQALSPDEYKWWDRFASVAEMENARQVYNEICDRYGAPAPGSMLAKIVDIALNSSTFWIRHHAENEPIVKNPNVPSIQRGWKKNLLRFAVIVCTDAISGGLAGAGGGGVVGGAIVGGLASYGADDILFGGGA